jgi:UDP-N-acetylglucosamine 2-epimerase (non-hydrolysing)/GDP/UDP-N,N'-diacetylbacillosamine 2-epimerase (hydrolysing)
MIKKKICVITGTRAEFGLLKPVMEGILKSEGFELQVLVTGMHLLPEFGLTLREIEKSGFRIDAKIPMMVGGDSKASMAISIGVGIIGITQALENLNPEMVVVLGDRYEILAAAVATVYSGRILVHLSGGDSPEGGYDEYTRHAITKLSHIHFPTTKKSAERIIRMGENPDFIYPVGSTALDTILHKDLPPKSDLCTRYDLDPGKAFILLVYHPLSTDPSSANDEIIKIFNVITKKSLQTIVIYPNADPGGMCIIPVIDHFRKEYPNLIKAYPSLPFEDYLAIMKYASCMVGNSSSGIMEAPSFHLPVVNIGDRQKGRERGENVIDTPPEEYAVEQALEQALHNPEFRRTAAACSSPYGDGHASERIVKILSDIEISSTIFKKKITY